MAKRATVTANATLMDAHTHKVIWNSEGISGTEQSPTVASSVVTTSPTFLQQNLRLTARSCSLSLGASHRMTFFPSSRSRFDATRLAAVVTEISAILAASDTLFRNERT